MFRFLLLMVSCASLRQAWRKLDAPLSLSTLRRLWRAFADQMFEIRRRLTQLIAPPWSEAPVSEAPNVENTIANARLTIAHLQRAFDGHDCPVSAYQFHFQQPIVA